MNGTNYEVPYCEGDSVTATLVYIFFFLLKPLEPWTEIKKALPQFGGDTSSCRYGRFVPSVTSVFGSTENFSPCPRINCEVKKSDAAALQLRASQYRH